MLKRLTSVIITLLLVFSMTACGNEELDYSKIVYDEVVTEVTDEMIQTRINGIIQSSYKEIETDRTVVQDGDIIYVTFTCYQDGEQVGEPIKNQRIYTFKKSDYVPGFIENCIGAEKGMVKEFELDFTADPDHPLTGQKVTYKLTVNNIYESGTYEEDEELAKKLGYDTMDEVREAIKVEMNMYNASDDLYDTQYNALKAYVDYCKLDVDTEKIENTFNETLEAAEQQAESLDYTLEQLLTETYDMGVDEYKEYTRKTCEAQEYYDIVTKDIINREGLTITDELKESGLEKLSESFETDVESIINSMNEAEVNDLILRDEALRILMDSATKRTK